MPYAMRIVRTQIVVSLLVLSAAALLPGEGFALTVRPLKTFALGLRTHRQPRSEQQQVLHLEDEMRSALLSADAGRLEKVLADDFLGVSANGTLSDRQQYLRRISKHEHMFTRIDVVDRKVRLQNASAIVVTTANVTGKLDSTPINGLFRYTRVWSREVDGSWRLRNFEATRVTGTAADELRRGIPVMHTQ